MSNSLAIAAVTETLRHLLDRRINNDPSTDAILAGTDVTTRAPDKARVNQAKNQVNLFLCHTAINPAWRNQDLPRQVKPGEVGRPPLALNLTYLITAYGTDDEGIGILGQRLLGRAMSILHDANPLNRKDIQAALPGNDLHEQIDAISLTHQPLSMEELIGKLWVAFQTPYRLTTAYEVTVVLIESNVAIRAALPVLQRGTGDRGPHISATLPPILTEAQAEWVLPIQPPPGAGPLTRRVLPPGSQQVVRLGDSLVFSGQNLPATDLNLRIKGPGMLQPIDMPLAASLPGNLRLDLPAVKDLVNGQAAGITWACGQYSAALVGPGTEPPNLPTDPVFFNLAPSLVVDPLSAAAGDVVLTVECSPRLLPEQESHVFLLFGSRQVAPKSIDTPTGLPANENKPTTLTFRFPVPSEEAGVYTVRLRVDGVDSLPFAVPDPAGNAGAYIFDPLQQVTIT